MEDFSFRSSHATHTPYSQSDCAPGSSPSSPPGFPSGSIPGSFPGPLLLPPQNDYQNACLKTCLKTARILIENFWRFTPLKSAQKFFAQDSRKIRGGIRGSNSRRNSGSEFGLGIRAQNSGSEFGLRIRARNSGSEFACFMLSWDVGMF